MWLNFPRMVWYRFPFLWFLHSRTILKYFNCLHQNRVPNFKCELVGWNGFIYSMIMAWFWHWHFIPMLSIGLHSCEMSNFGTFITSLFVRTQRISKHNRKSCEQKATSNLQANEFISYRYRHHWRNSPELFHCDHMETRGAQKKKITRGRKKRELNRQMEDQRIEESRNVAGIIRSAKNRPHSSSGINSILLFHCCSDDNDAGDHNMSTILPVSPKVENGMRNSEGIISTAQTNPCFWLGKNHICNKYRCVSIS